MCFFIYLRVFFVSFVFLAQAFPYNNQNEPKRRQMRPLGPRYVFLLFVFYTYFLGSIYTLTTREGLGWMAPTKRGQMTYPY